MVNNFVKPLSIPNQQEYIHAISEIFDSMSFFAEEKSRLTFEFLKESLVLLENATSIFEQGFFDAAFYSLRQSVEVASTFVYFNELSEEKRKEKVATWASHTAGFPTESRMLQEAVESGETYKELKEMLPDFFAGLHNFRRKINKYVHKQGYNCFYAHLAFHADQKENLTKEFTFFLKEAISIVAVFRMVLDPLPILLLDEEIVYRLPDVMTYPFSREFINKYMGADFVEKYKKTTIYKEFEESILTKEKYSEEVYDLKDSDYIPRDRINLLEHQISSLSFRETVVLKLVKQMDKITRIHIADGLITYFTEKTGIEMRSSSSSEFKALRMGKKWNNIPFKGGYLSLINVQDYASIGDDCYFIETLTPFSEEELIMLKKIVDDLVTKETAKYNEFLKEFETVKAGMDSQTTRETP